MIHIYCCTSCRELLKTLQAFSLTSKPSLDQQVKLGNLADEYQGYIPIHLCDKPLFLDPDLSRESFWAAVLKAVQKLLNLLQGPRSHHMSA